MNTKQIVVNIEGESLYISASEKGLTRICWEMDQCPTVKPSENSEISEILFSAKIQMQEYFTGRRQKFDLPLDLKGTPFQLKVWKQLLKIPYGETWSYQKLAQGISNPKAVRAVGTANSKNPLGILVPCHRVIRKSGEVGGYAGGLWRKEKLLKLESRN